LFKNKTPMLAHMSRIDRMIQIRNFATNAKLFPGGRR
jgi:hypothetical protein